MPALISSARADTWYKSPRDLLPGDYGYKHDLYHDEYQRIFGTLGRCACGSGDCRVTDWRETKLLSPVGYDVIVSRRWVPLPATVWMPPPEQVPALLRKERAHVCAYEFMKDGVVVETHIPCAIINRTDV